MLEICWISLDIPGLSWFFLIPIPIKSETAFPKLLHHQSFATHPNAYPPNVVPSVLEKWVANFEFGNFESHPTGSSHVFTFGSFDGSSVNLSPESRRWGIANHARSGTLFALGYPAQARHTFPIPILPEHISGSGFWLQMTKAKGILLQVAYENFVRVWKRVSSHIHLYICSIL